MTISTRDVNRLRKIIELCEQVLKSAEMPDTKAPAKAKGAQKTADKRTRRSGKELVAFRKMLVAERKRGASVAELAKKHGISAAYIYQL